MRRPPVIRLALVWGLVAACLLMVAARQITPTNLSGVLLAGSASMGISAALIACGLAAWTIRCQRSIWTWSAGAGAVVVLLIHLWIFSPFISGSQPSRPADATHLRIMTLNMRGGSADAARIAELVEQRKPDVLVLNEITPSALLRVRGTGLDEALPFAVGSTGNFAEGTVVFSRSRLNVEVTLWASQAGYIVTTRLRGDDIRLLAVHPTAPKDVEVWLEDLALVRLVSPTVDVVAGDLNATSDYRPFREILSHGQLRDAVELANAGWEPTFPTDRSPGLWGIGPPRLLQIDHVLVRDDGGVESVDTRAVSGTDHAAVIADVWFPRQSRDPRERPGE